MTKQRLPLIKGPREWFQHQNVAPNISVKCFDDGSVDEVFAKGYHFHMESMSESNYWIGLSDGHTMFHIDLWTPRTPIRVGIRNEAEGGEDFGEFSSGLHLPRWMKEGTT